MRCSNRIGGQFVSNTSFRISYRGTKGKIDLCLHCLRTFWKSNQLQPWNSLTLWQFFINPDQKNNLTYAPKMNFGSAVNWIRSSLSSKKIYIRIVLYGYCWYKYKFQLGLGILTNVFWKIKRNNLSHFIFNRDKITVFFPGTKIAICCRCVFIMKSLGNFLYSLSLSNWL